MKRTVAQSRMHHPRAQRGSKSHKDERRRDTEREPIVCPVPWNLHLETAGKLRVLLLWRSLWGGGGGKNKGRPLCSNGAVLCLDHGRRKLHGTMYRHTHGCVQLIHRLYQCQCPGCDRVLQLCKISLLGKLGKGVARLYLIVLHLPVRLELFPNEKIFF